MWGALYPMSVVVRLLVWNGPEVGIWVREEVVGWITMLGGLCWAEVSV